MRARAHIVVEDNSSVEDSNSRLVFDLLVVRLNLWNYGEAVFMNVVFINKL